MKLTLSEEEVKAILLRYANELVGPDTFNEVEVDASYNYFRSVSLSFSSPTEAA